MLRYCRNCGCKLNDEDVKCPECQIFVGKIENGKHYCQCGNEILPDDEQCSNCGQSLFVKHEPEIKNKNDDNLSNNVEKQEQTTKENYNTARGNMNKNDNSSNLTKKEKRQIEENIKDLGTSWLLKITEWLAITIAIWICVSGGDIASITHGVCCGIVACYLRLRRIHDTLSIRDLKEDLKG